MPSPSLKRIGRYEIVRELGRGTMGVVYEAQDPVLGRRIALKTIHLSHLGSERERGLFERRFLTEAQAAGQLSHPGIVVVHDVGRDQETGLLFIALEYLVGRTLSDLIAEGNLPDWRERLQIVSRVARALHHAHSHGVIHRDVKPANVMILVSGETKIMDFGIAKLDASELTSPGEIFGTPLYMAPEQAMGERIDARSDLFSLGSIAYVMLTGRPPFAAGSVPGILARVAHQDPPLPTEIVPSLPKDTDYFIARAMAKAPEKRYPDGEKMAEDIDDIVAGRPPRHRRKWRMPTRGEGTIYGQRSETKEKPAVPLDLKPIADKAPSRAGRIVRGAFRAVRRAGSKRLLAFAAVLALVYVYLNPHLAARWNGRILDVLLSRIATLKDGESQISDSEKTSVGEAAADSAAENDGGGEIEEFEAASDAEDEPTVELMEDDDASSPETAPSPATTEAETSKTLGSTPLPAARLQIIFEHSLRSGRLNVWIDRKAVLSEKLDSRTKRKFLVFTTRKGVVYEALKLQPGRHVVTAQVRWGGRVRAAGIRTTLKPGSRRWLEVILHRGKLLLRWRY